jgi:sugar phosphate isomerase/epimerase
MLILIYKYEKGSSDILKIGVTARSDSKGYGRWGDNTYKKLKEHGYSCSDYDLANTDDLIYTLPQEESDAILLKEKAMAEEAGIEITQVHGPWRWPPQDTTEADRIERMEKMKKSIRATNMLGCKNWVIHPIMPFGVNEIGTPDAQKTWDMNLEFMRELLKTAKEYGVSICLENMPMHKFSLATPEDILRFVKTIDDENFKICLDTGHVSVFGRSVGNAVRMLGDYIRVLHVHDNVHGMDLHMMPRFGVIDWEDFAKALHEIDFQGSFSLETLPSHKLPDDIYEEICISLFKIAKDIVKDI